MLAAGLASCPAPGVRNAHYLDEAEEAYLRGEHAKAAGHYEAYLQDNPNDPLRAELLARAGICHLGADRPDSALAAFERAVAANPGRALRWEIIFRRGVARRMSGDVTRALQDFRAAAAAPPAERGERILNDELYYEYALALFRSGDWTGGGRELAKVSDSGPYGKQKKMRKGLKAFAVQVGAFGSAGRAQTQAARLKSASRNVSVTPADDLFVVRSGPFARFEDARREAERLKRSGFPDAFIIP